MILFLGMKILWIFFGAIFRLYLGIISMHFRVFAYGLGTEWVFFFGL